MKKAMSLILTMALLASLLVISSVPVSAIDVALPDVVLGSGIPNADNLTYKDGNYEMNVVLASPSTTTVQRNANVLDIIDTNYRHNITSQIKYPADAGSGKLSFAFVASFRGVANSMTFKVYDKNMSSYGSFALCWGSATQFKANGNEAYNTTNGKNYTFKFDVDLETGAYAGSVNGAVFNDIGNFSKSFADFATRGIGMVEYVVNTGYTTSNTGVVLRGASVSDGNGTVLASGLPASAVNSYVNGDYKYVLDCDYGYYCKPIITNNAVKVTDSGTEHKIKSQIHYAADASHGTLRYEFDVTYIGSPGWRTAFNVYDKNSASIGTYSVVNSSSPNRYQHGSYPYVTTSGSDKLRYTVNLATGAFKFEVVQPSASYVLKEGSVDVSNGIGIVEYALESGTTAGAGMILNGASVKQLERSEIDDHFVLIDSVPSAYGTYNGLKLSKTTGGSASANITNGTVVISGATNSTNYARLNFEKNITSADNGRTAYVEVTFKSSAKLDGNTVLRYNAKDPKGGWPITGANLVSSSNPINADTECTLGVWLDVANTNRFYIYKNGVYFTEGAISTTAGIANIFFEYYNPQGATLTISDISYTVIEPSTYDAETNSYYTSDVMLLNGIPHYGKAVSWTQNNVKFDATRYGNATVSKLPLCDGITFTGSNNSSADGSDDYARLTITPNVTKDTFPEGIVYARWDFTLEGSGKQKINIASRCNGTWPINHDSLIGAGDHTYEFVYDPQTNMYKCIYDGVPTGVETNAQGKLPDVMLEWHGGEASDKLTLKNVRFMNIKSGDLDNIGAIEISDDKMTADVDVYVSEKYSLISSQMTLVIAGYTGNKLVAVNVVPQALKAGNNNIEASLEGLNGATSVKAFLIDSVKGLKPYGEAVSK